MTGFSEQTHDNLIMCSNAFNFSTLIKKRLFRRHLGKQNQFKHVQVMGRNNLALKHANQMY